IPNCLVWIYNPLSGFNVEFNVKYIFLSLFSFWHNRFYLMFIEIHILTIKRYHFEIKYVNIKKNHIL
ncbi:hypothetical protein, partial [Xenorhabdus szentirmaii]|uniref:hypothetical protein n=1 Tax=Xenorhabdus szentirmaii TaxID=290112 RepID=UPI002B4064E6